MEGDTLSLDCDASNSQPLPTVAWLDPQGEEISSSRDNEIVGISRTQSGIYTCVATDSNGETQDTTVNVIVEGEGFMAVLMFACMRMSNSSVCTCMVFLQCICIL